jgi:hypothetical protein
MSEPLRSEPVTGASAAADQAARIEQLLLSGLDHYFAGNHEQAIHVWTRVIFLERGHGRARAYIERARSALAERQRESEELLHRGKAAYNAGDVDAARDLLTQAVDEGAAADEALVFLHRLNRVEASAAVRADAAAPARPGMTARRAAGAHRRSWAMPALVAAVIISAVALGAAPLTSWLLELRGPVAHVPAQPVAAEPLPVVRSAETMLTRARDLYAGGHLHDALRSLDGIDVGDPLRPEANRMTADIQRDLLAAAGLSPAPLSEPVARP